MLTILILVFLGVFAVIALLLVASGTAASERTKQTLSALDAALATAKPETDSGLIDLRKRELFSAVSWINGWLLKFEAAPRLRLLLYQANVKWTVGGLLVLAVACFMIPAYLAYLRTGAALFSAILGLLCAGLPFAYVLHKRQQRFSKFEQLLPEALDLMVSALRAGHSMISGLDLIADETPDPVGSEFRICYDEQNYGLELRTALENLLARVPLQDLRIVATAILIQRESGGNLAEVLDKASYVIRERFRLKRQIRVHTAQGRLTGWILSLLPVVLGGALYLVNPEMMRLLWTRPIGLKMLYAAGAMTLIGALVIRKIVNMEV
jgi:tight adherence protein B